jgi:hypothetical protein
MTYREPLSRPIHRLSHPRVLFRSSPAAAVLPSPPDSPRQAC